MQMARAHFLSFHEGSKFSARLPHKSQYLAENVWTFGPDGQRLIEDWNQLTRIELSRLLKSDTDSRVPWEGPRSSQAMDTDNLLPRTWTTFPLGQSQFFELKRAAFILMPACDEDPPAAPNPEVPTPSTSLASRRFYNEA